MGKIKKERKRDGKIKRTKTRDRGSEGREKK